MVSAKSWTYRRVLLRMLWSSDESSVNWCEHEPF